jgi:ABC-type xylose transport system permease subunit
MKKKYETKTSRKKVVKFKKKIFKVLGTLVAIVIIPLAFYFLQKQRKLPTF